MIERITTAAEERADRYERDGQPASAVWALRAFASDLRAGIIGETEESGDLTSEGHGG